ncbi:AAA family ATPase [Nocardioides sp.]|uniref:AAA family ATPase n=1 Tax=Nocardioides sp. TaxID=35761 RepID=UPI0019885C97|nr:AAA family ATPase [Nocardioides sp.]MBC7277718.1 AAA family ATPase [Nocardioides sp.]
MTLDTSLASISPARAAEVGERPQLLLLGGVPGAGKSTLIRQVADRNPDVRTLDPETSARWLEARLPQVPYGLYRPLVHLWHAAVTLALVLLGPTLDRRTLLVHDPATRPGRRELLGRIARARGWRTSLVMIDVPRAVAIDGQHERGRIVSSPSFERHWHRWTDDQPRLLSATTFGGTDGSWDRVHVIDRARANRRIEALLGRSRQRSEKFVGPMEDSEAVGQPRARWPMPRSISAPTTSAPSWEMERVRG